MNKDIFDSLMCENGEKVVFVDSDKKIVFVMSDSLMNDESGIERSYVLEKVCEGVDGVEMVYGYGDDVVNCVVVDNIELIERVEGLEEFICEYIGVNCYSEE